MSTPAEELREDELNLSDFIHTYSFSPAPRSQSVPTQQAPLPANTPSSVPVLTLVCKRTNQPLEPPSQTQASPRTSQAPSEGATPLAQPREPSSNSLRPVISEPPSQALQLPKDNEPGPQPPHIPSPIPSPYIPFASFQPPIFSLTEIQHAHATITHLTQQLTLLKHQRDLLTHQRDIFIAQREEENAKFDAERASWDRLAEALIAQNARESAAGMGRKAVETAEKYALRVEDDNRSLRQKLLDANSRLTTLEKELDYLRPLLMVSISNSSKRGEGASAAIPNSSRSVNDPSNPMSSNEQMAVKDADIQKRHTILHPKDAIPVPAPINKKRRKAKARDPSQPLIPVPIRVTQHKGSPLSGDARAECMLSAAKTIGRRRVAQLGISTVWDPRTLQKNKQTLVEIPEDDIEIVEVNQPVGLFSGTQRDRVTNSRKSWTSSSRSHTGSSSGIKPDVGSKSLDTRTKKTNAIPIVPIVVSARSNSPQIREHDGEEVMRSPSPTHTEQLPAAESSSSLQQLDNPQPRRRGRPKGSKNKKRASQAQNGDDNVDVEPNNQSSQGFSSLLSAAMTLEDGPDDQAEQEIEEEPSPEEVTGSKRTRRQTAKAQAAGVGFHSRRRSRTKESSAVEVPAPPAKRRKMAASVSTPLISSPKRTYRSPAATRISSSPERGESSNTAHLASSRTVDGISRMRSALDVLADQAIQGDRRSSVTSSVIQKSLYTSVTQSVGSSSRTESVEVDATVTVSSVPLPAGADVGAEDSVALAVATLPAGSSRSPPEAELKRLDGLDQRSPGTPALALSMGSTHTVDDIGDTSVANTGRDDRPLDRHVTDTLPIPRNPSAASTQVHIEDDKDAHRHRSRSLSDRDASGEPEDPEEIDMVIGLE